MQLNIQDWTSLADGQSIADVRAVRVYFLSRGRNAWNWTWSRAYRTDDALHTRLATAKAEAERRRVQGNVFYIVERPAIAVRSDLGTFVAVHHAPMSAHPFVGWTVTQRSQDWWGAHRLHYDVRPDLTAGELLRALSRSSGHWRGVAGPNERILVAFVAGSALEELPKRPLLAYQSKAVGVNFYLRWLASDSPTKPAATKQMAARIRRRLGLNRIDVTPIGLELSA